MYSSELRNRLHPSAQNANHLPLNKQINFLKCDGVIAPGVTIKQFTLNVLG
jgi:hypothetical protein